MQNKTNNEIVTCKTCMWLKQYPGENESIGVCKKLHQYVYSCNPANAQCINGYTRHHDK